MADDYDKLTPEEREAKDKADREREAQEQAGGYTIASRSHQELILILESITLYMEARTWRTRHRGPRAQGHKRQRP